MNKTDEVELETGTLSVFNNRVAVIEIKYTEIIEIEDVIEVINWCKKMINGKFALISNRTHNYSINPMELYAALVEEPLLLCAAVIPYRETTEKLYNIEHEISDNISEHNFPLESFKILEDAIIWADKYLSEH